MDATPFLKKNGRKARREGANGIAKTLCLRLPRKRQRLIVSSENSV